ncbi:hypothetical protein TNCV_3395951 [Trichonephila clavipes]|nr:hypothetical protein TNCV_3395951 [Trichonephila clavipes]
MPASRGSPWYGPFRFGRVPKCKEQCVEIARMEVKGKDRNFCLHRMAKPLGTLRRAYFVKSASAKRISSDQATRFGKDCAVRRDPPAISRVRVCPERVAFRIQWLPLRGDTTLFGTWSLVHSDPRTIYQPPGVPCTVAPTLVVPVRRDTTLFGPPAGQDTTLFRLCATVFLQRTHGAAAWMLQCSCVPNPSRSMYGGSHSGRPARQDTTLLGLCARGDVALKKLCWALLETRGSCRQNPPSGGVMRADADSSAGANSFRTGVESSRAPTTLRSTETRRPKILSVPPRDFSWVLENFGGAAKPRSGVQTEGSRMTNPPSWSRETSVGT